MFLKLKKTRTRSKGILRRRSFSILERSIMSIDLLRNKAAKEITINDFDGQ
jgi:hypothetical protein